MNSFIFLSSSSAHAQISIIVEILVVNRKLYSSHIEDSYLPRISPLRRAISTRLLKLNTWSLQIWDTWPYVLIASPMISHDISRSTPRKIFFVIVIPNICSTNFLTRLTVVRTTHWYSCRLYAKGIARNCSTISGCGEYWTFDDIGYPANFFGLKQNIYSYTFIDSPSVSIWWTLFVTWAHTT